MSPACALFWFRNDLRIADNPGLAAACATGLPVLCLFVIEEDEDLRPRGGASNWRLDRSLRALSAELSARGNGLHVLRGRPADLLPRVAKEAGATKIFWNRRYGGAEIALDAKIKQSLRDSGREVRSFNASLLIEPWELATKAGGAFKVFTPFWRALREKWRPDAPLPVPEKWAAAKVPATAPQSLTPDDWGLAPRAPDWAASFANPDAGEAGAQKRLRDFFDRLDGYVTKRDQLDSAATSGLSPHLHFGEISPRQIFAALQDRAADKFQSEIGWREFSTHLLYAFPDLATRPFAPRFDGFPYLSDDPALDAWRHGQTGYPVVDAAMRQLWTTGLMHNRARMICASFLTKHLLIDWRVGENWFWDTLIDADPANNPASWQWVAGCGADAAPYFRIFNPVLQGEKFDPDGGYVRRFCPELAHLPAKFIHRPWTAPPLVLEAAGVRLGKTYPAPIIDHDFARRRALAALATISGANGAPLANGATGAPLAPGKTER